MRHLDLPSRYCANGESSNIMDSMAPARDATSYVLVNVLAAS